MGLPWLLQFLERAKRLPDVGLVHAVPSLLAFPSPPLRLTPGLVNSSSTLKHLPQPGFAVSTAVALHSCASQTQHRLQSGRPSVGPGDHKSPRLEIWAVLDWVSSQPSSKVNNNQEGMSNLLTL